MKTIAVIEDDIYIGNLLEETLSAEGYSVIRAYSGTEALLLLEKRRPDLILLDLMLPGLSGEALLPMLKGIPVIIVSAKTDVNDKAALLLEGAADYITKPFEIRELLARITVQLRRQPARYDSCLKVGGLCLDSSDRSCTLYRKPVHLTRTEFAILKLLAENAGHVISKSALLDRISTDTPDCTESSLKVHISNLRQKLKDISGENHIEAVWGIGFTLSLPFS
ncbi:MAG: response regulator transcription factor [Lachnospiraceae bacterium]|nr:response regulator transcription factor [Butyrivibrio sp.]MCM1343257.1 response regulator transcription factor [Muribaculaceae bacterium]MCM1412434.1 response regulator transcription factor [Lachnospiraceae bacterium]